MISLPRSPIAAPRSRPDRIARSSSSLVIACRPGSNAGVANVSAGSGKCAATAAGTAGAAGSGVAATSGGSGRDGIGCATGAAADAGSAARGAGLTAADGAGCVVAAGGGVAGSGGNLKGVPHAASSRHVDTAPMRRRSSEPPHAAIGQSPSHGRVRCGQYSLGPRHAASRFAPRAHIPSQHARPAPRLAQNRAMDLAAAVPADPPLQRWRRFALRGLRVELAALVIAVCLWAIFHQDFGITLVYSLCISTMCWLLIDVGRSVVAARLPSDKANGGGRWPSGYWMIAIVGLGAVLGYAAGNEIANRLTGLHLPGPFNADPRQTLSLVVMALVPAITITYFFQLARDDRVAARRRSSAPSARPPSSS